MTGFERATKIVMQLQNSSCGPLPFQYRMGSTGTIIAKVRTDNNDRFILHPYTHRYFDEGRVTPPAMLPDGFDMAPKPLKVGEAIPKNFAVILMGLAGTESIDYLSLEHSARPGMSTMFPTQSNAVVAIAIPVGIKQLSISYVTIGRRRAGARPNDTVDVHTPTLDIDRPGIYYVATLDTNHPGQFQASARSEQLKVFRTNYRDTIKGLEPINFEWPSQ
nr:hypothetical protein [Rhodoferax sp.]